jgi:hypothetical protein
LICLSDIKFDQPAGHQGNIFQLGTQRLSPVWPKLLVHVKQRPCLFGQRHTSQTALIGTRLGIGFEIGFKLR